MNMVLPLNVSEPSETAVIEHREPTNNHSSESLGFASIKKLRCVYIYSKNKDYTIVISLT